MYEIWSLGHKPFESIDDGTEVASYIKFAVDVIILLLK